MKKRVGREERKLIERMPVRARSHGRVQSAVTGKSVGVRERSGGLVAQTGL